MARDSEWIEYFTKRLAEEEKELAGFKNAIAKHGLRVFHRDMSGERDVTQEHIKHLEAAIAEYRAMLRDD
jgi:hypothetical protein